MEDFFKDIFNFTPNRTQSPKYIMGIDIAETLKDYSVITIWEKQKDNVFKMIETHKCRDDIKTFNQLVKELKEKYPGLYDS